VTAAPRRDPRIAAREARPSFDPRLAAFLEDIYASCNRLERLRRDPLAVVRRYADVADREVAALACSTLAFGSVDLIIRACEAALAPLGDHPAAALARMAEPDIEDAYSAYRYRYVFPKDMAALMLGAKRGREERGSLQDLFLSGDSGSRDIVPALGAFVRALARLGAGRSGPIRPNLLPDPARGSACKRPFLFLRWLVREDDVDPGGWRRVDRARLVVPLDLHMARVCRDRLGFIGGGTANLRAALWATDAFRAYAPEDPVKYDFALTRPGIDPEPGDERYGCA
jgi:uncharacterized protein (TIGR02757 family)